MLKSTKGRRLTVTILLAIVALIAGLFVSLHMPTKKNIDLSQLHGTALTTSRAVSPFSLFGTDQQPFNNASLNGQWTMMFFGFTSCGSVCPTTMAELGKMYRLLQEQNVQPLPQVVMVSVDPDRDSINKLSNYVHAFDVHFYGARGSDDSVKALAQEIGIAYIKLDNKDVTDSEHYDIEHTGTITLFNPKGQIVAFFTTPHNAALLAHDYMLLSAASEALINKGNNRL